MPSALFILAILCLLLDSQNAIAHRWRRHVLALEDEPMDDFTIVVPLYGDPKYFENEQYLLQYKDNTLLACCLNTPEMVAFADTKEREGWRVSRVDPSHASVVETLRESLRDVTTQYVLRLDGDSHSVEHPGRAVAAVHKDGADLCSAKVVAANCNNIVENLQALEYEVSMVGRHLRPWMTSGACHIARTDALRKILTNHTMWWVGEDMEVGRLARYFRMRVRHIDFRVLTEVPSTAKDLFKQRRLWWAGDFRLTFVNIDHNIRYPVFLLYSLVMVWGLIALKWSSLVTMATFMPTVVLVYTALLFATNWRLRSKWMILLPYYSGLQVLVMPLVGVAHFLKLAKQHGNWGRYRVGLGRKVKVWA